MSEHDCIEISIKFKDSKYVVCLHSLNIGYFDTREKAVKYMNEVVEIIDRVAYRK